MRRIIYIAALLAVAGYAAAQDIRVTKFEQCPTCVDINPMYDYTGKACALIRFSVRDTTMVIEPNNGYLKRETKIGEIRLHVPVSTKWLTLRVNGLKASEYELPEKLEQKVVYKADVETATFTAREERIEEPRVEPRVEPQKKVMTQRVKTGTNVLHPYIGLGWNVLPLNGPEVAVGVDINHHVIELGGVYGLKKTEGLYFYSTNPSDGSPIAGWYYGAIRGSLSYGYDITFPSIQASVVPMAGVMGSVYKGEEMAGVSISTNQYKKASSVAAFAALRLTKSFGKHVKLHVTPRYCISVYKSNNCKLINDYDDTLYGWTKGFNLSAGIMVSL